MKIYYFLRLVFYTAVAVLIGVFSYRLLECLPYLVGSVMILFGLEGMIIWIIKAKKKVLQEAQFFLGIVDLILGIVVVAAVHKFDYVCIIWATWTIVREAFDLYEIAHKIYHRFPAVLSVALSITEIVFSIMLLLYATEHHALTHVYLLIPEFIIDGLSPLLFEIHKKRRSRKTQNT